MSEQRVPSSSLPRRRTGAELAVDPDAHEGVNGARATESGPDRLAEAQHRFIEIWGEMASSWGVPRTMGEVHALLFIRGRELNADEMMRELGISRGNVSMTLRTLVEWGIVTRRRHRADRREYFHAEQDVWRLFATVLRARKRRELEPLLTALQECRALTADGDAPDSAPVEASAADRGPDSIAEHHRRLDDMLDMVRLLDRISERMTGPDGPDLRHAIQLLAAFA